MSKVHGVCVHKTIKCYCTISLIVDKSCFTALCHSQLLNGNEFWHALKIDFLPPSPNPPQVGVHSPLYPPHVELGIHLESSAASQSFTPCKCWEKHLEIVFLRCAGWTWTRGSSTCRPPELTGAIGNWRMVCLACCTTSVRTLAERFDFNWWIYGKRIFFFLLRRSSRHAAAWTKI